MIRAGDVVIPHDAKGEQQPSWRPLVPLRGDDPAYPADPRRGVLLVCKCGGEGILRSIDVRTDGTRGHEIDADGTVSPSIGCANGCGWHIMGRLMGWTGGG